MLTRRLANAVRGLCSRGLAEGLELLCSGASSGKVVWEGILGRREAGEESCGVEAWEVGLGREAEVGDGKELWRVPRELCVLEV